ncbi:MAG: hypothetical protein N3A02_05070, partial [Rectinema sp.]|nr:hypothetical protein [Rectinema sp.]
MTPAGTLFQLRAGAGSLCFRCRWSNCVLPRFIHILLAAIRVPFYDYQVHYDIPKEQEMDEEVIWWAFDAVESFMRAGFEAVGVDPEPAAVCADVLISADKRGVDSHGV